jgi:aspartate aminotransferase
VAAAASRSGKPIRLWFGESDSATPEIVRAAAQAALEAGETFYAPRRGLDELREGLAVYLRRLHHVTVDVSRITVTASGMSAIMIALQAVVSAGSNVVIVSPIWPNISNAVAALGATVRHVPLERDASWRLNVQSLFEVADRDTSAIFIASPGNPTGWICETEQQREILAFCESRGIYLIADEVYQRFTYDRPIAPSFLEHATAESPLIVVNSFSKTWAMTGWRLGWMVHPTGAGACIGELNAVNTTGAATFVQRAGVVALQEGESFVASLHQRCVAGRDLVHSALVSMGGVSAIRPPAGFYSYFFIEGIADDLAFASSLAANTGVGLAPGSAFGPASAGFFRICFALHAELLQTAMERLARYLASRALMDAIEMP